jgi:nitrite reductase (NO-forming)
VNDDRAGHWVIGAIMVSVLALGVASIAVVGAIRANVGRETVTAAAEPMTIDVVAKDLFFEPASVEVPAGTELTVNLTNEGDQAHDFVIEGGEGTALVQPGASASVDLGVIAGDQLAAAVAFFCVRCPTSLIEIPLG